MLIAYLKKFQISFWKTVDEQVLPCKNTTEETHRLKS